MRLKLTRSIGSEDLKKLGLHNHENDPNAAKAAKVYVEGSVHDFKNDTAETLLKRNLGEQTNEPVTEHPETLHAVPVRPTITAPAPETTEADESPVSADNAHEAIDQISRMRSPDKLRAIIDTDTRPTVKKAAQDRLDALPK
jgi:hypothetical protein